MKIINNNKSDSSLSMSTMQTNEFIQKKNQDQDQDPDQIHISVYEITLTDSGTELQFLSMEDAHRTMLTYMSAGTEFSFMHRNTRRGGKAYQRIAEWNRQFQEQEQEQDQKVQDVIQKEDQEQDVIQEQEVIQEKVQDVIQEPVQVHKEKQPYVRLTEEERKERQRASSLKWYHANKETKVKQKVKPTSYDEFSQQRKEYYKTYYEKNRETIKNRAMEWNKKKREQEQEQEKEKQEQEKEKQYQDQEQKQNEHTVL